MRAEGSTRSIPQAIVWNE